MNLNFTMSELIHSDIAIKHNINNMPDINSLDNMLNLIVYCLQPIRDKLGKPITITSGYRCSRLVEILKSSKTGHPQGQCADLKVNGMTQQSLFDFIRKSGIEYDQLILEDNADGYCVHIGYRKGNNRRETLLRDRKMRYSKV